jgi:(p)ppGpp synthase/HD superfamily hydrolase
MLPQLDQAIAFAARAHEGQRRKTGDTPFIAHPFAVAMIVQAMGGDETAVIAALLHDTVEDSNVELGEIRATFGAEVAALVAACTELPKKHNPWEIRKSHHIESLRHAPLKAKLITAADKYHNLSHILNGRPISDPAVWQRFSRGAGQQAWYYRTIVGSLLANVDEPADYPIFAALSTLVDQLFDGIPSQPPPPQKELSSVGGT